MTSNDFDQQSLEKDIHPILPLPIKQPDLRTNNLTPVAER